MREPVELAIVAGIAAVAIAAGSWLVMRRRKDPAERERIRRLAVNRSGRMADGNITDVADNTIYYSYKVRGVEYLASQDVSSLGDRVPGDLSMLIGPATFKYVPANPANSIVLCEEWSGFRKGVQNKEINQA
jgi:hypothetical protein